MAFPSIEAKREYFKAYYLKRRNKYIEMLGGKCAYCPSQENLQFDHKDANDKTLNIGKLLNYAEEKVLKELEKCQLLCADCHKIKTIKNKDGFFKKAKGEAVSSAVLTEEDVLRIRELLKTHSTVVVARMYSVNRCTILAIKKRKTWKHI